MIRNSSSQMIRFDSNNFSEESANWIFSNVINPVVELEENIIKEAIKFRKTNKKRDLSYVDCIGYI